MSPEPGREVALAVTSDWYKVLVKHWFLKNPTTQDGATELLRATLADLESPHGMWVKPHEDFSPYPAASLFVPWAVIVAAILLGPDEAKNLGFGKPRS